MSWDTIPELYKNNLILYGYIAYYHRQTIKCVNYINYINYSLKKNFISVYWFLPINNFLQDLVVLFNGSELPI